MNPVAIEAENFHRYPELQIALPQGCTAIVGPNGAGKSSLLEAMDVALFGGLKEHMTLGETRAQVCLEFDHRGDAYRVRRGVKSGKPSLDLERLDESGWTALTRENVSATQAHLEELLGISRDTLRASSLLMQNDGAAFTAAKPSKRKELLCDALGLDIWPWLQARTRDELRAVTTDLAVAQATATRLEEEVAGRAQLEHDIDETLTVVAQEQELLDRAENALTLITERYQRARELAAVRAAAAAELKTAQQSLEQLRDAEARIGEASKQLTIARDELATLPTVAGTENLIARERELLAAIAAHERAHAEHAQMVAAHDRATTLRDSFLAQSTEAGRLSDAASSRAGALERHDDRDTAKCELCGQALPDEARARAIESYTAERNRHRDTALRFREQAAAIASPIVDAAPEGEPPTAELEQVRAHLAAAQHAQQQRVRLEERIVNYEAAIKAEPDLAGRIALAVALVTETRTIFDDLEPVELAPIEAAGAEARANVERYRTSLGRVREQLASLRTRLEQLAAREAELAAAQAQAVEHQARIDLLKRAETAYGPAGIPTLVLENAAIPQIETEANRFMQALGWSYRIRLDTQRELASRDGLRESLDIIVETQLGEQTWERCSGGEQMRVNLALRLAIAALIATRKAVEVKLLAIDEPDGLDADGFQRLVDLLHDLEARGIFEKILIVSHHPELKHAFEQVIEVSGGGDSETPSAIVQQAEPVAA